MLLSSLERTEGIVEIDDTAINPNGAGGSPQLPLTLPLLSHIRCRGMYVFSLMLLIAML